MNVLPSSASPPKRAEIAVVGSGFAASFFLWKLLQSAPETISVVVLERGALRDHATQIAERPSKHRFPTHLYRDGGSVSKPWNFALGVGGSSNCWSGNTPRQIPTDFELATRCGVGRDWPFRYEDLEPHYCEVERVMEIAGNGGPSFMSTPYPLGPHRFSDPEKALHALWPGQFFPMPTARATAGSMRPQCCTNDICRLCPIDAKFTILNGLWQVYEDARVTVVTEAEVEQVDIAGGRARGLVWRRGDARGRIEADHVVLAANGLFNPHILLRSGDDHLQTGRRLHEQVGLVGRVYLDGMDSFQGSTSATGYGTMLYDDDARRKDRAALLVETDSAGRFRTEPNRWRQVLPIRLVVEDLPLPENRVRLDPNVPDLPVTEFNGISDYASRAIDTLEADLAHVFGGLPVERIEITGRAPTESHIQGTTVMGDDPADSVVDQDGLHHVWRDLRVLGSSVFPTGAPANPTLTLSAHAVRAADRMETW